MMEEPPKINPPFGRVPGQELLLIPISELRRRRNSGEYRVAESSSRVSGTGGKYMPKGGLGGGGQPLAALGGRLARGCPPSGSPSGFWSLPSK